ncbi:MAG: L-glutamate gamma-semialdehyde dehydrogenase [Opitutales bacterium]
MDSSLEDSIYQTGKALFEAVAHSKTPLFSKDRWYRSIMEWSMKNAHFKTQMFRFVDVLPCLYTHEAVATHLREYFADGGGKLPPIFSVGLGLGSLAPGLTAGVVKKNVEAMAKLFITGENASEALPKLAQGRQERKAFTIDILGEATLSESEAERYQHRYMALIKRLKEASQSWDVFDQIDTDDCGSIPKVNVSVKLSSLYSQINLKAWKETKEALKERLRPIFTLAKECGVFINLDMEQYSLKNLTLEVFEELLIEPAFADYPHWGIVLQAYLRDTLEDAHRMVAFAKKRDVPFTIRLVKGAYWDYEVVIADQMGWPVPVFTHKPESDTNFEACAQYLLDHHPSIKLAAGSHNIRSLAAVIEYAKHIGLPSKAFELQMLYGMAEPIKLACIDRGYRIREYATIGEMIPGMAYLVRRLLENTSNESFLRSRFEGSIPLDDLLKNPADGLKSSFAEKVPEDAFSNQPLLDFTIASNREAFSRALDAFKLNMGQVHPIVIGGKSIKTERTLDSLNPSHTNEVVGRFYLAGIDEAEQAVQAACKAFPHWRQVPAYERIQLLEVVADILERDRFNLAAVQVHEVGKPWSDADGDVCEAIDFCRYYAGEMRRLAPTRIVGKVAGERNEYLYEPRGLAVVIAPWNFPLAILTGMVVASWVTGNTVIMKPAEQSTLIAAQLMEVFDEAGLPPGVVNFLPGLGEDVGDYLVCHKNTSIISFTGSKEVGLGILQKAHVCAPGQRHIKRCITEMGGKNAMIVDADADLDEVVPAVLYSAFGFSGQKCSALSRLIVLDTIHDALVERLVECMRSLKVRPAEDPEAFCGPVIDQAAQEKIFHYIELGKQDCTLAYQSDIPEGGCFVPLTLFTNVKPTSVIAREEIFGPVLGVIRVATLDEAFEVANDSEYALTGGVFSRSPGTIERAKAALQVGNLYINRGITGAMVDRQPFGGFKLSGVGSKTGGPDYLLQFMEPKSLSENTLRRGFTPEE